MLVSKEEKIHENSNLKRKGEGNIQSTYIHAFQPHFPSYHLGLLHQ